MITLTEQDGFAVRQGTLDANMVLGLAHDEYRLASRSLEGWAIDIGAYIGTVAITLARQNPDLRVIAVEAVPENADILEQNAQRLGLGRVSVVRAWAAGPNDLTGLCHYGYTKREAESDGYVAAHRFVGNTWGDSGKPEHSVEMPAVSLDALLKTYGIDEVSLLKIDCEGCEWAFLDTPAISKVKTIVGEYHGGFEDRPMEPRARLVEMLPNHRVEFWSDEPLIGLFQATRR